MSQPRIKLPFTAVPNELWDLPEPLTPAERTVVDYVCRHTIGFHIDCAIITLDEFQFGRRRADGSRIDKGTGMSENTIMRALRGAVEKGILYAVDDQRDKARKKKWYGYNFEGDREKIQKLNPEEIDPCSKPPNGVPQKLRRCTDVPPQFLRKGSSNFEDRTDKERHKESCFRPPAASEGPKDEGGGDLSEDFQKQEVSLNDSTAVDSENPKKKKEPRKGSDAWKRKQARESKFHEAGVRILNQAYQGRYGTENHLTARNQTAIQFALWKLTEEDGVSREEMKKLLRWYKQASSCGGDVEFLPTLFTAGNVTRKWEKLVEAYHRHQSPKKTNQGKNGVWYMAPYDSLNFYQRQEHEDRLEDLQLQIFERARVALDRDYPGVQELNQYAREQMGLPGYSFACYPCSKEFKG